MTFSKKIVDYKNPKSLGNRFRRKRFAVFGERLSALPRETDKPIRIADLGGTVSGWATFDFDHWEKIIARRIEISLLNIEAEDSAPNRRFQTITADCTGEIKRLDSYDLVYSNSVVEHLHTWEGMRAFANNCRNLAKYHFVQTPNFYFPVEPHHLALGIHFLPRQLQVARLVRKGMSFDEAFRQVERILLLTRPQLCELFPESEIFAEKILFLTKSLIATNLPLPQSG